MATAELEKSSSVVFSFYNPAFDYFNQTYVNLCQKIAETMSLRTIRSSISAFAYEFSYAVPSNNLWNGFRKELYKLNKEINEDRDYADILRKDEFTFKQEVAIYPLYYKYFTKYLDILNRFVAEMSATYLPRTRIQQTLVKFKNDSAFYMNLHKYSEVVHNALSDFDIVEFRKKYNLFLTYYYAYKMFVTENLGKSIDIVMGKSLSLFINDDVIRVLAKYPDLTKDEQAFLYKIEEELQNSLLYCNSLMKKSLSGFGVIPKVIPKLYADRWLI